MDKIIHNCVTNGCTGSNSDNLHLVCLRCNEINYLQCLFEELYEFQIVMCVFGVFVVNVMSQKATFKKNIITQSRLNKLFGKDSALPFICSSCDSICNRCNGLELDLSLTNSKIESLTTKFNELLSKNEDLIDNPYKKSLIEVKNNLIDFRNTANEILALLSSDISDSNDASIGITYEICLSQFPATECDNISTSIADKHLNLNDTDFTITKLGRQDDKRKKPVSFKISTKKEEIYNLLITNELWAPFYSAKNFVEKAGKLKPTNKIIQIKLALQVINEVMNRVKKTS